MELLRVDTPTSLFVQFMDIFTKSITKRNLALNNLKPDDLFTKPVFRYPDWLKINNLNHLMKEITPKGSSSQNEFKESTEDKKAEDETKSKEGIAIKSNFSSCYF